MDDLWWPEATETGHVSIINALRRGDTKTAMKVVLKKCEKSKDGWYQAIKCLIQARHSQAAERGLAMVRIMDLADKNCQEFITDLDQLEIYSEAADELATENHQLATTCMGIVRLRAVQTAPKDEKLAVECLKQCFSRGDFDSCQRIAKILKDNFPKNRGYTFWLCTFYLLLSESPTQSDKAKEIFSNLAVKVLQMYVVGEIAPKYSDLPLSFRTTQEALLYHHAVEMTGDPQKGVRAGLDPRCGVNSPLGNRSWAMIRSFLFAALEGNDDEIPLRYCAALLGQACANVDGVITFPMGGDWLVWETYITSIMRVTAGGTKDIHHLSEFFELNSAHRFSKPPIDKPYMKNARLALVKFMTELNPNQEKDTWTFKEAPVDQATSILDELSLNQATPLVVAKRREPLVVTNLSRRTLVILEYLHEYGHIPAGFGDISPYFSMLNGEEREQLLSISQTVMINGGGWIACEKEDSEIASESVDHAHFPPATLPADQITATINHFKLSYLNTNFVEPYLRIDAEKDPIPVRRRLGFNYIFCNHCRVLGTDGTGEQKVWSKIRSLWCEQCLRAAVLYGVKTYDHALNGYTTKGWKPFELKATDMHPGDDAAIIAAMALIKLGSPKEQRELHFPDDDTFAKRHGTKRLIQAAALLEFAHSESPANPQILLLLVRLYSVLGAGSLAMRAYSKLKLKQIQGETLGYVLFDRMSTLHPHPCHDIMVAETPVPFSPAAELSKLQEAYKRFKRDTTRNYMTCLQHGSYNTVFQLADSVEKLFGSYGSIMSVLELRKLEFMMNPETRLTQSSHGYNLLPREFNKDVLHNNLDSKAFPDYELPPSEAGRPFIDYLSLGPAPNDFRLRADILVDQLDMVFGGTLDGPVQMRTALFQLRTSLQSFKESFEWPEVKAGNATADENDYFSMAFIIIDIVIMVGVQTTLNVTLEWMIPTWHANALRNYLVGAIADVKNMEMLEEEDYIPTFANTLHPLYMKHRIASLVVQAEDFLGRTQIDQGLRGKFKGMAGDYGQQLRKLVKQRGREIKKKMETGGYIDKVIEWVEEVPEADSKLSDEVVGDDYTNATLGRGLRRVIDREFLDVFAENLVASWQESVIGLVCLG